MDNFEEIEKRSYERYLFELAKEWAEELERRYENPLLAVDEVRLVNPGTPKAGLQFHITRPCDGEQLRQTIGIYGYPFYKEDGTREDATRAVGDVLMWIRG